MSWEYIECRLCFTDVEFQINNEIGECNSLVGTALCEAYYTCGLCNIHLQALCGARCCVALALGGECERVAVVVVCVHIVETVTGNGKALGCCDGVG